MKYKIIIKNTLFLLTIFTIPLIYEYIGINYGGPLGVRYYYLKDFKPQIFGLPLAVWIFWVIFIYIGYSLTNSIFYFFLKENFYKFINKVFNIILLSFFDGFVVLTFDIFLDPVCVRYGLWRWENFKLSYFGVPVGNFIGWYIIAFTTTTIIRTVEKIFYYYQNNKIYKIIPYIYLLIIIIFFVFLPFYIEIDIILMALIFSSPIVLLSLIIILNKKGSEIISDP